MSLITVLKAPHEAKPPVETAWSPAATSKLRPSGRADTGDRDRQIHALRDAGKSLRAIAAEVKCSVGTVVRVLKS